MTTYSSGVRVCPKRDAVCPHGLSCPYVIDRYNCRDEPSNDLTAGRGEEALVAVAKRYAAIVRECELRRTDDEPPPQPLWQAAWTRRMTLLSELLRAAEQLP